MVMVGWVEKGSWFLEGDEDGLEALVEVGVLGVGLGAGGLERRAWRRARAWAAVRVGEGEGVVVVGVWGGVGWAAIFGLGVG